MADTKISALTAATTPLAGTEVLPIVQSGVTKQVSVADLTAGRAVSALSLSLTNALTAANGGTGQSSYAVGDLLYASTTTALSKLADVATGNALISGGVGVAPSWGKIGLTTHVSGTLPVANGGTNLTSFTANGIVYASSTSALATNSALTWSGTVFTATGGGGAKAKLQDNTVLLLNSGAIASGYISFQRSDGTQKAAIGSYYNVADEGNLEFIGPTGSTNARLSSAGDFYMASGNIIPSTAAKGINFTANSAAAGMTSQLLNWYEAGTFTATLKGSISDPTTPVTQTAYYTRVGDLVTVIIRVENKNTSGASGNVTISGLPFTSNASVTALGTVFMFKTSTSAMFGLIDPSTTVVRFIEQATGNSATWSSPGAGTYGGVTIQYKV